MQSLSDVCTLKHVDILRILSRSGKRLESVALALFFLYNVAIVACASVRVIPRLTRAAGALGAPPPLPRRCSGIGLLSFPHIMGKATAYLGLKKNMYVYLFIHLFINLFIIIFYTDMYTRTLYVYKLA